MNFNMSDQNKTGLVLENIRAKIKEIQNNPNIETDPDQEFILEDKVVYNNKNTSSDQHSFVEDYDQNIANIEVDHSTTNLDNNSGNLFNSDEEENDIFQQINQLDESLDSNSESNDLDQSLDDLSDNITDKPISGFDNISRESKITDDEIQSNNNLNQDTDQDTNINDVNVADQSESNDLDQSLDDLSDTSDINNLQSTQEQSELLSFDDSNLDFPISEDELSDLIDNNDSSSTQDLHEENNFNLLQDDLSIKIHPDKDLIDQKELNIEKETYSEKNLTDNADLKQPNKIENSNLEKELDNILVSNDVANRISSSVQDLKNITNNNNSDLIESGVNYIIKDELKKWLDNNLPDIVDKIVREEISKIIK
tara:strand:+ start:10995 stop:12098 length:1104 start_codon:yes stop_codon:yes gene_type:complete